MKKTRVLICGASGFIGRNLFEHLSQNPELEVHGTYFRNQSFQHPNLQQVDLTNPRSASLITRRMDVVINAAAITDGLGAVSANPARYISGNIRINTNLTEAVLNNQIPHYIFMSCTVMYPSSDFLVKESDVDLAKIHPKYFMGARVKLLAEDMARYFSNLGSTRFTMVRHSNIYGPYDKFDLQRGHVFAATVTKVMSAKKEIVVWGNGEEERDLLHVSDLARFVEKVIHNTKMESPFEIYNVGIGESIAVRDLVGKIVKISGRKLKIKYDPTKPSINTKVALDTSKAYLAFNWYPLITLNDGIKLTLGWYRKNYLKDQNQNSK